MGSLTSKPKAPASYAPAPQVVYYTPAPAPAPSASAPAPATPTPDTSQPAPVSDETKSAVRAENLLKRSRSRLGTILTGFTGILSQSDLVPQRKTLLGE